MISRRRHRLHGRRTAFGGVSFGVFRFAFKFPSAPDGAMNYRRITGAARPFSAAAGLSGTGATGSVILVGL